MRKLLLILFAAALMTSLPLVHAVEHEWTNKQGKTINAEFVSATNEAVTISMQGKVFVVKLTDLSPQSRALAAKLRVQKSTVQEKEAQAETSPESNQSPSDPSNAKIAQVGKIDLDDPETRKKIIANAVKTSQLQRRGKKAEELLYAKNQQTPYTGWTKLMDGNGQIKFLTQRKDGKKDGLQMWWHENGQKKGERTYKDGRKHGLETFWYENGQKEAENTYRDGKEISSKEWGREVNPQSVALAKRPQGVVKEGLQVKNEGQVLGKAYSIPKLNLDMLWCKPGTFMMGSPAGEKHRQKDETQHEVTLTQGFYLGKYEVTQEQWKLLMGSNPSYHQRAPQKALQLGPRKFLIRKNRSVFNGATLPVETVSWEDAMKFCRKLTQLEKAAGRLPKGHAYTLPTEAQWEYACRAGTTTTYSVGDTITPRQANHEKNVVGKPTPVGTYPANAWGFHDLHGNVWEWCSDWYGDYPSAQVIDPIGPSDGRSRVYRGGSWDGIGSYLRSATRAKSGRTAAIRYYSLGFRLSLQTATAKTE